MVNKKLYIRFDIDTLACLKLGVPRLLEFACQQDVRFVFFINLGRAYSPGHMVKNILNPDQGRRQKAARMGAIEKLGYAGVLKTLFLNPSLGSRAGTILDEIVAEGHDLGLHGGRNHGRWQHNAQSWSERYLCREIAWGVEQFDRLRLPRPKLFSSPGFNGPPSLSDVLLAHGFEALFDKHAWLLPAEPTIENGIQSVGTGLLAEPGGVGFFENQMASGRNPKEFRYHLEGILKSAPDRLMVYDHPAFTGRRGLGYLSAFLEVAEFCGYSIEIPSRGLF